MSSGGNGLVAGYRPGLLGWVGAAHGRYYAEHWGFGRFFEAKVIGEIAEFAGRLDRSDNEIWSWWEPGSPVGAITVDGDRAQQDGAHLRWFIVERPGAGIGRTLIEQAMRFCRERRFASAHLWTFAGLDAARHLYESCGFELASEQTGRQWGATVTEQRFVAAL